MDIKIEQWNWIRTKDNRILQCVEPNANIMCEFELQSRYDHIIDIEDIIKVANTPQELIEVGDLVYGDFYITPREVYNVNLKYGTCEIIEEDIRNIYINGITKILTPKGKDFICQWEVE